MFNENALHHPALPLYVQEHSMLKYKRAWLPSINKGYNPNKPNKLKVYASIKKSFSLENYVSCYNIAKRRNFTKLRISSHHLAIEKGRYTRPITPREQRFGGCGVVGVGVRGGGLSVYVTTLRYDKSNIYSLKYTKLKQLFRISR